MPFHVTVVLLDSFAKNVEQFSLTKRPVFRYDSLRSAGIVRRAFGPPSATKNSGRGEMPLPENFNPIGNYDLAFSGNYDPDSL